MKNRPVFLSLITFLIACLLFGCNQLEIGETATETSIPQVVIRVTSTPTPTVIAAIIAKTQPPPEKLTGTLEIRFPDPWERPEFCASEIPYELILVGSAYELRGEGAFYCYQWMTFGESIKHHLIQDYAVSLTGSKPLDPGTILDMNLVFDGQQESYFSDLPPGAPEIITESNPFHLDVDNQLIAMRFRYEEGAYCLWNKNGVFTSLPGEEPPVGEDGWLFILHPHQ